LSTELESRPEWELPTANASHNNRESDDATIINAATTLATFGGVDILPSDRRLLTGGGSGLDPRQKARLAEIVHAALNGFFHAAAKGYAFGDPDIIRQRFGRTLAANYPDAGPAFLRFAQTYWTLKLILDDRGFNAEQSLAHALLSEVEGNIGALFFPTPGPVTIEPAKREAAQREIVAASGAPINVEEFISQNPILLRDKVAGRAGCFGSVVFAVAVFGVVTVAVLALLLGLPNPALEPSSVDTQNRQLIDTSKPTIN